MEIRELRDGLNGLLLFSESFCHGGIAAAAAEWFAGDVVGEAIVEGLGAWRG